MVLRRQISIASRWVPWLILCAIIAGVATYLYTSRQPQLYQASATLLPEQLLPSSNSDPSSVSVSRLAGLSTSFGVIATTRELLADVGQELQLSDAVTDLAKRVSATADPTTAALTITARAGDPSSAAALANAVARAVEARSSTSADDQSLLASMDAVRKRMVETEAEYERLLALPEPRSAGDTLALGNSLSLLHELTTVYDSLNASASKGHSGLLLVGAADQQAAQLTSPLSQYYALLAALAGLIIAAAIAFVFEYLDDRIKNPEGVKEAIGAPTLGVIPRVRVIPGGGSRHQLYMREDPRSPQAHACRMLRATIELASVLERVRTLLVTSATPSGAKSATAANLAVAFAQAGRRVVLVDGDLRNPAIHDLFHLANTRGLSTLLHDTASPVDSVAHVVEQGLRVVTAGPMPLDPAADLGSDRMRALIDRLLADSDIVIFDSPSLQSGIDAAVIGSIVDDTLLVVPDARGNRQAVIEANDILARSNAHLLGAVLYGTSRPSLSGDQAELGAVGQAARPAEPANRP